MLKFKLFFDKDKETNWLNEMSDKGYELQGFTAGGYRFGECELGKYRYQIDISKGMYSVEEGYKEFMQEQGIEIVCLWGPWVILRKLNDGMDFKLYSDNESLIEHYTKIRTVFKVVTALELVCLMIATVAAFYIQSPLYYVLLAAFGLFALAFVKITFHTNAVIEKLKGESGEGGERRVSVLLIIGLLINAGVLLLKDNLPDTLFIVMETAVIALMTAGIIRTARKRNVRKL